MWKSGVLTIQRLIDFIIWLSSSSKDILFWLVCYPKDNYMLYILLFWTRHHWLGIISQQGALNRAPSMHFREGPYFIVNYFRIELKNFAAVCVPSFFEYFKSVCMNEWIGRLLLCNFFLRKEKVKNSICKSVYSMVMCTVGH